VEEIGDYFSSKFTKSGTDVMISKNIFAKKLGITLIFEKNANLAKIAENRDHSIDPRGRFLN
jgi:hypothetical protein